MRSIKTTLLAATALFAAPAIANAQTVEADRIAPLSEWNTDELYQNGVSAENLIDDADVYGLNGEEIGDVENIIFNADGTIASLIAEVGGFWDIGDTHVNIPWNQVQASPDYLQLMVPVTEDNVGDYSLFEDDVMTTASTDTVQEVDDDLLLSGNLWRATELIDDYARLANEGGEYTNYGYVDDIIIQDGRISAVIVDPDVGTGLGGDYAFPFYGRDYGWQASNPYYDLPYVVSETENMNRFDRTRMMPQAENETMNDNRSTQQQNRQQ